MKTPSTRPTVGTPAYWAARADAFDMIRQLDKMAASLAGCFPTPGNLSALRTLAEQIKANAFASETVRAQGAGNATVRAAKTVKWIETPVLHQTIWKALNSLAAQAPSGITAMDLISMANQLEKDVVAVAAGNRQLVDVESSIRIALSDALTTDGVLNFGTCCNILNEKNGDGVWVFVEPTEEERLLIEAEDLDITRKKLTPEIYKSGYWTAVEV